MRCKSLAEWVSKGSPAGEPVVKAFPVAVDSVATDSRELVFRASDGSVDRDGEIVSPSGWRFDGFRKNPVFVWNHNYSLLPLARVLSAEVLDAQLIVRVKFRPEGVELFADRVFRDYLEGYLNAVSVGYLPLKMAKTPKGAPLTTESQDLLEVSAVVIPANPNATRLAYEAADREAAVAAKNNLQKARLVLARGWLGE